MRPRAFYVVFSPTTGLVVGVFEGAVAARQACGGARIYDSFSTRLAAEEHASWWEHERPKRLAAFNAAYRAKYVKRYGPQSIEDCDPLFAMRLF